ncbi:MAG: hypothetical protein IJK98_08470, partial [Clostridia bacterium]|nr:hypothetical protein [Clostridia bacterium]
MKHRKNHGAKDRPVPVSAQRKTDDREKEHFNRDVTIPDPQHDPFCSAVDGVDEAEGQIFQKG